MYNFKIIHDSGRVTVIRARTRAVAIRLFCEGEGCSRTYFADHSLVRRVKR